MDLTQTLGTIAIGVSMVAAYFGYRQTGRGTTVTEFNALRDELRKQLNDERRERLDDREQFEARIAELERKVITAHERADRAESKVRVAVAYIRVLTGVMREHGIEPPPAPPEIEMENQ